VVKLKTSRVKPEINSCRTRTEVPAEAITWPGMLAVPKGKKKPKPSASAGPLAEKKHNPKAERELGGRQKKRKQNQWHPKTAAGPARSHRSITKSFGSAGPPPSPTRRRRAGGQGTGETQLKSKANQVDRDGCRRDRYARVKEARRNIRRAKEKT